MPGSLGELLPPIYRERLPEFFGRPEPGEEKATCDHCAMCQHAGEPEREAGLVTFRPDTKCCTFHPKLPGYLVGAILEETTADMQEGRRRMRERIATRVGVTPGWLAPPRKFMLLLDAARTQAFGRSLGLRCPYYESQGGLCTIWRHREADCSTFFCKYSAGADGQAFWRGLRHWLVNVEQRLSEAAVHAVAPELSEPQVPKGMLTLDDLEDRPPSDARYASYWRSWAGREAELYVACHRFVQGLSRDDLVRLGGDEGERRLAALVPLYERLFERRVPVRLRLAPDLDRLPVGAGQVWVTSYSRYEPTLLSDAALELLARFTGEEPVAAVREQLQNEGGVSFDDELLVELARLRILVEDESG